MKNGDLAKFILGGSQDMVFSRVDVINRQQRRSRDKEFSAIVKNLCSTEGNFLTQLFEEGNGLGYDELYEHYNNQYTNNVSCANRLVKPIYFEINEKYFSDTYRSVV